MKIGFIGTGVIATAMVHGIAQDGHNIVVSERSKAKSAALSDAYSNVTVSDNQTVLDQSDVIIIGLMAQTARDQLGSLTFSPRHQVFSVMVDIYLDEIGQLIAPATAAGIFIPYPSIAQGNSPLLVYPQSDIVDEIFGGKNFVLNLGSEAELNSYLAAQAILLPTIRMLAQTSGWLAQQTGDINGAERFIRILVGEFLTARDYGETAVFADMIQSLGTEGGLNAQLRDHFGREGVYDTLDKGLNQLSNRLAS